MTEERVEGVHLRDGLGRLSVARRRTLGRDEPVGELRLDGRVLVDDFADGAGSVGRIFRYAAAGSLEVDLAFVRASVAEVGSFDHGLAAPIRPLLRLFENGVYSLTLRTLEDDFAVVELEVTDPAFDGSGGYHPIPPNETLLPTRPDETLDDATIASWRERIRAGARPVALLAELGEGTYAVLDGHHKLLAYTWERVSACVLSIRRV